MNVVVVKYNAGNVYSVVNALRRLGVEPLPGHAFQGASL